MKKKTAPAKLLSIALTTVVDEYLRGEWGFTGTRAGMSDFQRAMMARVLTRGQPLMFRHGGAWGADTEAHAIWRKVSKKVCKANVWPADEKRAALFRSDARVVMEDVMPPLARNICIVDRSALMLATPNNEHEEQRSGTWQAIRESLKRNRPVLIMWPRSQKLTLYRDKKLYRVTYTIQD